MALREILARFDLQVGGLNKLASANSAIGGFVGKLQNVAAVIGGSVLVGAVTQFVRGIVQTGDEIATTADRLGLSARGLQEWRYIATAADVSNEELSGAFKNLTKNMFEAGKAGSEQARIFDSLDISVKNADGTLRSSEAVMGDVLTTLGNMSNETERSALAMKVFGKNGLAMNPLLKMSEDQVRQLKEEFERLGGGMSDAAVIAAGEADQSFNRFDFALLGLKSRIALDILPAVTTFVTGASELIAKISKLTAGTNIFKSGLIAAGIAAAGFLASLLLPLAPVIAKFLLLWLVIDDILTTIQGGESVIQGLIDKLFGVGSTRDAIWRVKDILREIGEGDYAGAVNSLADGLERIGSEIIDNHQHLQKLTNTQGPIQVADIHSQEAWNQAIKDSRTPLQQFGDGVFEVIEAFKAFGWAVGEAVSAVGSFFSTIGGGIAGAASAVGSWIAGIAGAIATWYTETNAAISAWLSSTVSAIGEGISSFFDAAYDLGASIIDGIVDGLNDGVEELTGVMGDVVQEAIRTANEKLESKSPSKVFTRLGRTMPQGLAAGIEQEDHLPARMAANMVGRTVRSAAVTMHQTNQIAVHGSGNPMIAAQMVGRATKQATSGALDDAYAALVPEVA